MLSVLSLLFDLRLHELHGEPPGAIATGACSAVSPSVAGEAATRQVRSRRALLLKVVLEQGVENSIESPLEVTNYDSPLNILS